MKPFLRWRDDWLLGVDALDSQHLAIAALVNQIFVALGGGYEGARLNPHGHRLLLQLVKMTHSHFQSEEAMMLAQDYPAMASHHREHLMLLAELHDLVREIEEGRKRFTLETLTSLKHWMIDHMISSDKDFVNHLHLAIASVDKGGKRSWHSASSSVAGVHFSN